MGATMSGGETTAPRTKATAQGKPSAKCATPGEEHAPYGKQGNWSKVLPEALPAHTDTGRIEKRRQEEQHHDRWIELHYRQPGYDGKRKPGEHEQDRVRHSHTPRGNGAAGSHGDKSEEEEESLDHDTCGIVAPSAFERRRRARLCADCGSNYFRRVTQPECSAKSSKRRVAQRSV